MDRAYSTLEIKAVSEDARIITGVATTPRPDRMDDIIEPMGVSFKNPMPLLWQHRSDQPVGSVKFDTPTEKGITFTAQIAKIDEPGILKDRLDLAWQSVKAELVKAVSIGFRAIEYCFLDNGGVRFVKSEVMELSLVTIPANMDATIQTIKSIDTKQLAASGRVQLGVVRTKPAGVSAPKTVKRQEGTAVPEPIAKQIAAFEATKAAKSTRIDEIMDAAAEKGETCDDAQMTEIKGLEAEIVQVDEHLVLLRNREKRSVAGATLIRSGEGDDPARAAELRGGGGALAAVQVRKQLPKGTGFTRYAIALAKARGNLMQAAEMAKMWHDESPEVELVLRAAVAAGTTTDATWASPLVVYQNMASEFIELLRPQTIVGKIDGFRRVPFNIKVPRQTGGSTVNWVGEASVKPITSVAFDQLSLGFSKIAGIIPLSEELVRFSSPSAEALVTADLIASIAQFMDVEFIDPTNAPVTNVSPASVTYGATSIAATGVTAAALRADVKSLMALFLAANLSPVGGVWIMTAQQALAISLMVNALGQPEFPGVTMLGGTFLGFPVIASENVPTVGASPTDGSRIVFLLANQVLLADDGLVTIDASREASLQMDTAPDSPATASTVMMSLWQNNMVAIKAERYINWLKRHDAACAYINYAKYAE